MEPPALHIGAAALPPRPIEQMPLLTPRSGSGLTTLFRTDRLRFLKELAQGGDVFRARLLDKTLVVVTGPGPLHECLVERAADLRRDPLMRHVIYPLLGEGLITSDGALWKRQRKLMAPLFTPAQLARYADDIGACTQRRLDTWREGEILDVGREMTQLTMAIAGKILFGADMFSETDALGAALATGLEWTGQRLNATLPLVQLAVRKGLLRVGRRLPRRLSGLIERGAARLEQPLLLGTALDRRMQEAVAVLDRRVQRMVDERRASTGEHRDLLARLLAARGDEEGQMSDKQLRDEIITLFVAGHETTAVTLAWTLYLLARDPDVYRSARAQVDALSWPPRASEHVDLSRLDLVQRCFKEAMRLYPPIPALVRETVREVPIGGYRVPADTVVLLCPYATHHRADLWPDPDRFDPDRFTPAAEAARPRHAFMAFSGGPRICLGSHLALMEGPLVLAAMLRRADFELTSDAPVEAVMREALRPRRISLRVRLRRPAAA